MSALSRLEIRRSRVQDAERLAAGLVEGFETYREFQPEGWEPPTVATETARMRPRLAAPDAWGLVALDGDEVVGQVLLEPARELDGIAHLANLFVARAWWGSGLARELHRLAVAAMREQGYVGGRLFTPQRQARARRFYEREGWLLEDAPFWEDALQMALVEYRLSLVGG